jgi:PAS domain S-box-containing protein
LTIAGFVGAGLLGERDARRESEHRAEVAAVQMHGRVVDAASLAASLGRYTASVAGTGVTNEEFASNASRWLSPAGFPAAGWVEEVGAADRAAYEQRTGSPIVARDQRRRIVPVESRSSYLPATLVSGIPPITVPGLDLGGESGMAGALLRARALHQPSATPLVTLRDGTMGLFLVSLAQRGGVVKPGFAVVFVSGESLRAAAADTPTVQLSSGGAATGGSKGAATVRKAFTEAGQRFDVVVPLESVHGAAAALPWIILAAGLVLAALTAALGVSGARRARAQEELDRIFTLSSDLITVANFDGYFTRVNPAVKRILGYTEEEFLARPYLDFVHPGDREGTAAEAAAISRGKTTLSFENRYLRKDGSYRMLEWISTPAVKDGATYGVARDVTDRHQAEAELARLAGEQAALRRVATLVAHEEPQAEVFKAIAEEIGQLLGTQEIRMVRYEDEYAVVVAAWGEAEEAFPVGSRQPLGGDSAASRVLREGRPSRMADYSAATGSVTESAHALGIRSAVACPIVVGGRTWGAMVVVTYDAEPFPPETQTQIAQFSDLVATAIANTEARAQVERLGEEQTALRRVATLVARGIPPEELFAAVTEEVGRMLGTHLAGMARYNSDDTLTMLATWADEGEHPLVAGPWPLEGGDLASEIWKTRRPVRIDDYHAVAGRIAAFVRDELGISSSVGCPIVVEGRLWGALFVHSKQIHQPLPRDTESRLTGFTELVATAIANAQSRAELVASRARIVAAADETRRRIERDLHDGIQQRLVSLGLEVRATQPTVPPQLGEVRAVLSRVVEGLASVFDELREISHGIHPAILSEGGLQPALRALRRRSAVPVELDLRVERRLPEPVEVAVYYVVSEGLTNAAKHARASVVNVELDTHEPILRLVIRDDGIGAADPGHGTGLLGLSDRIEALGGTLQVTSPAGKGTTLLIEVPLEDHSSAASPEP